MQNKIFITGMHSGQNPCSGVGIARSLRKAFPHAILVGVDHWQGSSGLHDAGLNDVLLLPQWKQLDSQRHVAFLRSLLDAGNLWISCMDMEVHWLAENFGRHRNLLAPSANAIEMTAKPMVQAFGGEEFKVPEFISASLPDSEIHSFLRHNSWQCWLKSPYHDAKRISSWPSFERARSSMSKTWKTSRLFLQRHVSGNEETIAFAADRGELVSAVHLQKRQLTPEGKTWAGRVSPVAADLGDQFRKAIRVLDWSGGGELEFVRDPDGQKWIIECNPRFPAWIYGAAVCGMNVPARLISQIWNLKFLESKSSFPFFTRVVQEIPAKEEVGIPLPPDPTSLVWTADGKKGKSSPTTDSLLPELNESKDEDESEKTGSATREVFETLPLLYWEEVKTLARTFEGNTPARIHLEGWTLARFQGLADRVRIANSGHPAIKIGYSVKTSPTDDHLRKAMHQGFLAECISQMEVRRALEFGFKNDQVILNGPGKFWPITVPPVIGLHSLFCDSTEEFERTLAIPGVAESIGLRIRLPNLHSRFGNSLDDMDGFQRILACVRKIEGRASLGFHFHMPSWAIGVQRWMEALSSLLIWCQSMERLSETPVRLLDLGGGLFPQDLERINFAAIQKAVASRLPKVQTLYFEPGRSLTQDGEVLISRVLDARRSRKGKLREIVVDACVAELPLAQSFSHRVFYQPSDKTQAARLLTKGDARALGRICMEDDILSNGLNLPDETEVGDFVIFGDAGGYERSMSYVFGRG